MGKHDWIVVGHLPRQRKFRVNRCPSLSLHVKENDLGVVVGHYRRLHCSEVGVVVVAVIGDLFCCLWFDSIEFLFASFDEFQYESLLPDEV